LWFKRIEPEAFAKTARFLQSKDYLTAKLTGSIDVTDFSDASHAQLIDIHQKAYMDDVFADLALDRGKFPAIFKGTDVVGRVTEQAARDLNVLGDIPVIAGGGDGACANVGAGITTGRGEIYCNIGTTAWLAYSSPVPVIDEKSRVFDIMSLDGENFGVFGTMQSAGKCIDWARKLFDIESSALFDREAQLSPPGSEGLIFLPYLDGERSPIFDANARGLFFNIGSSHERRHFLRSILEGVSFALRSILDIYREKGKVPDIRLISGGANSRLWLQILADIFDAAIWTTEAYTDSVTSMGVALAAGTGVGIYKSLDEAAASVKISKQAEPQKDNVSRYVPLFEKYTRLYPQLKSLFGSPA
jgi:xylulokinase